MQQTNEEWAPDLIPLAKSGQIKTIGVSNHHLAGMGKGNGVSWKEGFDDEGSFI